MHSNKEGVLVYLFCLLMDSSFSLCCELIPLINRYILNKDLGPIVLGSLDIKIIIMLMLSLGIALGFDKVKNLGSMDWDYFIDIKTTTFHFT